jgi:beta-lactam-binding protein with PASTA domain/serine/threonine protein kinase
VPRVLRPFGRVPGKVWCPDDRRLPSVDTTVADPLQGAVLEGRYRIRGRIARGGMATVYHALDTRLERTVAVKVLHPAYAADPSFAERFVREARAIARLSHPNVVAVFDQGTYDDQAFLVMEYVRGRTLRDVLVERGRLSPAEATSVLEPMLDALTAAHRIGMVHRDVKPENVLIGDDGSVKVADFGLARVTDAGTATATRGVLMGTVAYVPPELVTNGNADPRSDVYSAGIVLYEMLTGTRPFRGEPALSVAWQHVNADVPPPSDVIGGLPEALDELTLHATRREPGARPTDAGAFLAELRDVRADLALPLVPPPPRTEATAQAHPTIAVPRGDLISTHVPHRQRGASPLPVSVHRDVAPPEDRPRRPRRRGPLVVAIILVLGLLAGATGWYLGIGQYTQAPSVLDKTRAEARATLVKAGLGLRIGDARFSETTRVGTVVAQDPKPTDRIRRDGAVTVFLSKGPERHAVPTVVGAQQAAAERAVRDVHLRPVVKVAYDDEVARGVVVSAKPKGGTRLPRDTVVTLVVSKGPPPVTLTDVRGKPAGTVSSQLRGLGLKVTTREEFDDKIAEGLVISQDPGPGTVLKGSTVELVVSKGPPFTEVPQLEGLTFEAAQAALEARGLTVRRIDIPGGRNRVLSQEPAPGTRVRQGTAVLVYTF